MNSVCRFIEDNVFCVKFCVHAVASDTVPLSRRRVRLRSVCIDWIGHTMSYSLHLRSVEDHLLLDNVWRYLLNLFMVHPRHELICSLSKSDIRSHDRLSLKTLSFDHGSQKISQHLCPSFLLTRSIRWLRLTQQISDERYVYFFSGRVRSWSESSSVHYRRLAPSSLHPHTSSRFSFAKSCPTETSKNPQEHD